MRLFFFRLLFILALVSFQISFFDILFPWMTVPIAIFVALIVWSLLIPFPQVFMRVIPTTMLLDIISSGTPGIFSLYAICLVYATSFLSRRLSIEQSTIGITLSLALSASALVGFRIFSFLFSGKEYFTIDFFLSFLFSKDVLFSMLLCIPTFLVVSSIITRFERYMTLLSTREFSRIK
ncbi:MAG: hypothetical protein PHH40_02160 [Candidatus Moranbacteria bacterium]|nr:hypothetical protein [Candidatus Moranbacteria bacterium]MDD3964978.1 hypothetical protein [Candidatus Moranbacteria bacterium]